MLLAVRLTKPILACAVMALVGEGCASAPRITAQQRVQGLVYVLPGIEGKGPLNISIAKGLADGGVPYAIDIFDWGGPFGALSWYSNLTDENRNRAKARQLAREILDYKSRYPDRPVHLVAHSGGAGIALMAVESLPSKKEWVETVILLAGAVSRDYDLTQAMKRMHRGLWNFYSKGDLGFLGVGTTVFGTVDREHAPAAGAFGFEVSDKLNEASRLLYERKFNQHQYTFKMAATGNLGTHFGWASPYFAKNYLTKIIMDEPIGAEAASETEERKPVSDSAVP